MDGGNQCQMSPPLVGRKVKMMEQLLLNVSETAKMLRLQESTIRSWVLKRKIPFVKMGSRVFVRRIPGRAVEPDGDGALMMKKERKKARVNAKQPKKAIIKAVKKRMTAPGRRMPKYRYPRTSVTRRSKLLCPECKQMEGVASVYLNPYQRPVITLKCGHTRFEILPSKEGSVSIEASAPWWYLKPTVTMPPVPSEARKQKPKQRKPQPIVSAVADAA
jgi:excisionase family DNA binding protein